MMELNKEKYSDRVNALYMELVFFFFFRSGVTVTSGHGCYFSTVQAAHALLQLLLCWPG